MLEYQERRVLIALANGNSLSTISEKEGVTLKYLKNNILSSLYYKLGARNAIQAVAQGFVKGCIGDEVPATEPKTTLDRLTEKESLVCSEWRADEGSRSLAERLQMSDASVRSLLQKARNKTGLTNEELARALAIRRLGRVS